MTDRATVVKYFQIITIIIRVTKFVKELETKITEVCEVEDIATEIEEAEDLTSRVLNAKRHIFERTHEVEEVHTKAKLKSPDHVPTNTTNEGSVEEQHSHETILNTSASTSDNNINDIQIFSTTQHTTAESTGTVNYEHHSINTNSNSAPLSTLNRSKLPKLVLPKFRGDVTQWKTFWDSFNSAIHNNSYLTTIDKFNHLNSLLKGQALRVIQGLILSYGNYQSAIDTLHQRFGKTQHIISTHMDELLKILARTTDKTSQLRFIYDKISINVRGLEALEVNSSQYGSLLKPVVMSKLPQEDRLQIARYIAQDVWKMSELLSIIRKEVEAREISDGVKVTCEKPKVTPPKLPRFYCGIDV